MPDALVPVRDRVSFSKLDEALPLPDLVGIQRTSFDVLLAEGLKEVLEEVSPIEDFTEQFQLHFGKHHFNDPKFSEEECKDKDQTFSRPLFVEAMFVNKTTGEIKEQEVFMGDFPMMTERGTFIINGTERVVVSQLVRSPGVYFSRELDKTSDKDVFIAKIIPSRGAWLEFDVDKKETVGVRIDRKRRQNVTVLLKALGWSEDEILALFSNARSVQNTLEKDHVHTPEEALEDIYRKLRPGEPPTAESARTLLENLFFNHKRYDLAKVGRYKVNKKLEPARDILLKQLKARARELAEHDNPEKKGWDQPRFRVWGELQKDEQGEGGPKYKGIMSYEDMLRTVRYLVRLAAGEEGYEPDDIDHFGNRRLRSVGELIQNQIRIGLSRMERVVRERMTTQDVEAITPQTLINIRPVVASIKEFFGTSQLSQFMDQTNPLAGLTHKRRLSALGPGGLSRERAGFEVRDVHPSHYGRMCPIETPEGPNIGLIGSLSTYGRINPFGFIETPYRRVTAGKVTDKVDYLSADEEDRHVIAQANEPIKPDGVEHDDANRALMGANMQRQAVPLLRAEAPIVGTGVEFRAAVDAGDVVLAEEAGVVEDVSADDIVIRERTGDLRTYKLMKFRRSNQGTSLNQKPLVAEGDTVIKNQVIGDGPSTESGELALGRNLVVAYMPWEGHNYEDAIIISERLVKDDVLTSVHIEEHEVDARDTKLGAEEITRDIPNVSEEILKDLDERGIVRIGAEVNPGDYLVGKVTPKGETELTPEERLLRAIFGEKAREVRDTSLKVPHGESGKVIGVRVFTREDGDELPPGVNQLVRVYVAQKRKISDGDKLAGRHGNKGVISTILPEEDMPFLADGTPVDIILNPLGVPSRMNLGQVLEAHLGWAGLVGFRKDGTDHEGPVYVATPVFDGAREGEILEAIRSAHPNADGVKLVDDVGKAILFDGRNGEPYEERVTVGVAYILKLLHLVDDKIHARSTGPYSMITQQPLGGKAQFGGQRFGEMEVWALEAYGAAYALQELLTIKSDDVLGRVKVYEAIVKGENIPEPGIPESFKVLIKEMQSLCLNVEVRSAEGEEIELKETDEDVFRAAEELGIDLSRREPAGADFD
uniref:DNA-directed RNA polymerase subunit beta n=1 Tax=uncultured actinobacterium Rifle_16ft_4_minimus_38826 TaxID=1665148 RepID=A0A0H4TAK0_9ACTN|nr:DNA-directed RNA polymerase subunit beta, DNA-directed RNA polymerase subunit beta [uncultured actinobacterium Rifle_16ft_4_minimus_38826]